MANKSVLIAVAGVLAFALTPAFINAQTANAPAAVNPHCLVRVYHTNFNFPPEGGRIVQIGSEMFFWKNYLPQCANAASGMSQVVSSTPPQTQVVSNTLSGSYGTQLVDSPCAVRVYHTNFNFPAEGGQIVRFGNEMFFIRSYRPECAGAGQGGTIVMSAGQNSLVQPVAASVQPVAQVAPTPAPQVCY
jgi:hypothetical protein